jgi:hypothetical protein
MMDKTDQSPVYLPTEEDYSQLVAFRRHHVLPPGALYITVDELIQVSITNPSQTVSINLTMRMLLPSGKVIPEYYQFPNLVASGTATSRLIPGVEGYLLSATVDAPSISRGAAYVVVSVKRGRGSGDATAGDLICEGYPGGLYLLNYPFSAPEPPNAGPGLARSVTVANPAAGADWSVTVPAGASFAVNSVSATLVTSAGGSARVATLVITDAGGNVVFNGPATASQNASSTENYTWSNAPSTPPAGATSTVGPLPAGLRLGPGWTLKTVTSGIQAGDQWSAIVLSVQQYAAS